MATNAINSGPWGGPVAPPPPRKRFRFIRGAWKVIVAVKDLLVLLLLLLFFGLIWAGLSGRPGGAAVGTGALVLQLNGTIVEQPETTSPTALLSGATPIRQFALRDLVRALDKAASDDRVKAVVLDLDGFLGAGNVALGDVGDALDRVRAAKKPIYAYATGYSDDAYRIAAHATQIWLDPMGLTLFAGPGGSRLYYKGLFEQLGVNARVYRVGTFKSAVEPYILDRQSPEARTANEALARSLFETWLADIARARPQAKVAAFAADPVAATANGDLAQSALAAGLVDKLGDRTAFAKMVADFVGPGKKGAPFAAIDLAPWIAAHPAETAGSIGVVTVAGVISDGEVGPGGAGGDTISRLINEAVASGAYKALVVRIDSPGGSAIASEQIRSALIEAKAKGLPVVVSMGSVAASGGYWVAMAGDRIFAEPATITGSIGVFGVIPTFEAALGKWGVTTDGVKTTPLSGQPDLFAGTTPAFDAMIQRSIEATYRRFIGLVSGARKMEPARVDAIAQGRVWDGGTARQLGLIDAFGGLDAAVAEAARRAKIDPATARPTWIEKPPTFLEAFASMFAGQEQPASRDLATTLTRARMAAFGVALADARMLVAGSALQARCFECPLAIAPKPADARLLDALYRWKN